MVFFSSLILLKSRKKNCLFVCFSYSGRYQNSTLHFGDIYRNRWWKNERSTFFLTVAWQNILNHICARYLQQILEMKQNICEFFIMQLFRHLAQQNFVSSLFSRMNPHRIFEQKNIIPYHFHTISFLKNMRLLIYCYQKP